MTSALLVAALVLALGTGAVSPSCDEHGTSFGRDLPVDAHLDRRIAPPPGFVRRVVDEPFGAWLRHLPLRDGTPAVRLFDGRARARQDAHAAVLDLDVGRSDLQQCADTVLRLRAEWLWSRGAAEALSFRFTSGDVSRWTDWAAGMRPRVTGSRVAFVEAAAPDASRASFRRWLDSVFTYAGTISLRRDTRPVPPAAPIEAGDVFVQAGSPGHAVLVVDVVESPATGDRAFLLVQGFMPAQEAHVLINPASAPSPWYPERFGRLLVTPDWTFAAGDRRRF